MRIPRPGATLVAALTALGLQLPPLLALACPTCATREAAGLSGLAVLAAMIAAPLVIAAVTIRVVRKLERGG